MTPDEDPQWHAVLDAMRQAAKNHPDEPDFVTSAMHTLADLILEVRPALNEEQVAVLIGVGSILWSEGMKEAKARVQTMIALNRIKPVTGGGSGSTH